MDLGLLVRLCAFSHDVAPSERVRPRICVLPRLRERDALFPGIYANCSTNNQECVESIIASVRSEAYMSVVSVITRKILAGVSAGSRMPSCRSWHTLQCSRGILMTFGKDNASDGLEITVQHGERGVTMQLSGCFNLDSSPAVRFCYQRRRSNLSRSPTRIDS